MSIRKCRVGDEATLSLVGQASFLEAFAGVINQSDLVEHCTHQHSAGKYRAWLDDGATQIWLAEVDPGFAPIGYLVLTKPDLPLADLSAKDLEVKRIYLLHRFQGKGLGRRLMEEAKAYGVQSGAPRLLLGVYAHNCEAIAFYNRLGYAPVGRRSFKVGSNHYEDFIFALSL